MAKPLSFDVPSTESDIELIVEDQRLYVNSNMLSLHSHVFRDMFNGTDLATIRQIVLEEWKHKDFLEFLRVIYPPHSEAGVKSLEGLLKLADYYQVELVRKQCDRILSQMISKNWSTWSLGKKMIHADKYKLKWSTMEILYLEEVKKQSFMLDFLATPEYKELSLEFKNKLFENMLKTQKPCECHDANGTRHVHWK